MNKKNFTIIIVIFVFVIIWLSLMFYLNLKDSNSIEIVATVKLVGNNYIIVEDGDGKEYSLNIDSEYKKGDKIDFIIKNIEKDSNPIKGEIIEINLISRDINFQIEDEKDQNVEASDKLIVENNNSNYSSNDMLISSNEEKKEVIENTYSEDDVISYITTLDNDLTNYNGDKNIGDSLKKGFVTIVDFIFYDGTIKGKTFKELSSSAKLKVLEIALSIDKKIEKYFPNYKEEISGKSKDVYSNLKTKVVELYLDTTTKICEDNLDACESAKEGLEDLRTSFSITWDYIKKYSKEGKNKLRDWYEVWREN